MSSAFPASPAAQAPADNHLLGARRLHLIGLTCVAAAVLAACGGGGDSSTGTGTQTPSAGTLQHVPQVTSVPAATYPAGSPELEAFNTINATRAQCGFGQLAQDTRLDTATMKHSNYMLGNHSEFGHYESNKADPWFSGYSPDERMIAAGYPAGGTLSEGMSGGDMDNRINLARYAVATLLSAPYHGLDILSNRLHIGLSFQKKVNPAYTQNSTFVATFNYGSPANAAYQSMVQDLPSNDVLTYPCAGTQVQETNFTGEVPNPLPGRNTLTNPVGQPIYVVAKKGSGLVINSIKLTQQSTGKDVPLMAPRYSATELFPGTSGQFGHAYIMDWAFVFPDVGLEKNTLYRVDLTATVSGKLVAKSFTYSTTAASEMDRGATNFQ